MGAFERPDLEINETVLADRLAVEILPDNLSLLVGAGFLLAMDARDRRLAREYFQDVLTLTFNFQNRLVRLAELATLAQALASGKDLAAEIEANIAKHMATARDHQDRLQQVLRMFTEMRGESDSVS